MTDTPSVESAQSGMMPDLASILAAIGRAQTAYFVEADTSKAFDGLLSDLLALTQSGYGFIGEVLQTPEGQPYLKTHAITNISWDDATRRFYAENAPKGMAFYNLKTLFGHVLSSGQPVIANAPAQDPRRGGLPPGHPPLNAFLGIPIRIGDQFVGMAGLANRPGGYSLELIDALAPLLSTAGNLILARRTTNARQQSEDLVRRLSLVASKTTNAVIITDAKGMTVWANTGFERITGYSQSEILGHTPGRILQGPESDPDEVERIRQAIAEGKSCEVELINYSKAGVPYWVHISMDPVFDESGTLQNFIAIESDITERKRVDKMKNEFVSTVSHELRTPLTAIRGALGLMAGGALGTLPDQARELVDTAYRNSERLTVLINDLLDMEKIAAGQMRFELQVQPVMPLVEQAIQAIQSYANQFRVSLELSQRLDQAWVNVDGQRFQQVLTNFLSNAVKFSPLDSTVTVRVEQIGEQVRVTVADQGPGIPDNFRDRIFQKFSQADASDTRTRGGTGLGLAITKGLAERMGGSVGFESSPGQGAAFHVLMPLSAQPDVAINPEVS